VTGDDQRERSPSRLALRRNPNVGMTVRAVPEWWFCIGCRNCPLPAAEQRRRTGTLPGRAHRRIQVFADRGSCTPRCWPRVSSAWPWRERGAAADGYLPASRSRSHRCSTAPPSTFSPWARARLPFRAPVKTRQVRQVRGQHTTAQPWLATASSRPRSRSRSRRELTKTAAAPSMREGRARAGCAT
jgi:hypothetical protein